MKNSNDNTAKYYDIVNSFIKGDDATNLEIGLINKYLPPHSRVLDIGGGSGRHSLILATQNFKVDVVDSSKSLLQLFKEKLSTIDKDLQMNIKLHNKNIFKFDTKVKYDLIIMFWNTFNEIALTKKDAIRLLNKCKKLLKTNGKILINIDNPENINPSQFDFSYTTQDSEFRYDLNWKTYKYFSKTNTSISKEEIIVTNIKNSIDTKTYTSFIKQRYWSLNEIKELCNKANLKLNTEVIKNIDELYLLLTSQ